MATSKYADSTTVSPEKSLSEIRSILSRFGATAFTWGEATSPPRAMIEFDLQDRRVRFVIDLPEPSEFTKTATGRHRPAGASVKECEQATRSKWRSLALVVKAKLVAVDEGVVTFEQEFSMHFVTADNRTVYQHMQGEKLNVLCSAGKMPALLPGRDG